jgi:glycosyltransferase involved in cell wall biosynthesis
VPNKVRKQDAATEKKVAIVCDWLIDIGGAERVVLELHKLFPDAPIYTSQYDPKKLDWFKSADVRTGYLQKLPKVLKKFLPLLRARWFSRLDLSEYDLVISSSGAEAKFIRTTPKKSRFSKLFSAQGESENRKGNVQESTLTATHSSQHSGGDESTGSVASSAGEQASAVQKCVHVSYIHAPTHYYWSRYNQYLKEPGFGYFDWLARLGLKLLAGPMRKQDFSAAQKPDYLIANSAHTANEIKKYYKREATVIHPPVDIERFKPYIADSKNRHGYVITGRQTPYKKISLAVAPCTKLSVPLVVIGNGPDHKKLKKVAGTSITFVTTATDEDVAKYVGSSKAFIFPGTDDFGIAPVEALAAGTPVIAFKAGGALDYVIDGKNGRFFDKPTVDSLCKAIQKFEKEKYSPEEIKSTSKEFGIDHFHKKMLKFVQKL